MIKYALQTVLLIALTITSTTTIEAQNLSLTGTSNSVVVSGTSSLHDWEMILSGFKASTVINKQDDGSVVLDNAVFTADANNLSSDNSLMDKKAHEALNAKKAPEISFRQSDAVTIPAGGAKSFNMKGDIKIAGQTKSVSIPVSVKSQNNGTLQVKGTLPITMSDYQMEPPTAMFGTVKTGDEVKVNFNLSLK
ncbi:YceI family protein [Marinilabilia sp.]|uniref:YceI family protein n=1 Tax=Marinilabilia sp. TaxID=2021252 RepID=UPI0025BF1875|nr:YceI family protein [Marinilabilia sp.]